MPKFSYTEYKYNGDNERAIIVDIITLVLAVPLIIWLLCFA